MKTPEDIYGAQLEKAGIETARLQRRIAALETVIRSGIEDGCDISDGCTSDSEIGAWFRKIWQKSARCLFEEDK